MHYSPPSSASQTDPSTRRRTSLSGSDYGWAVVTDHCQLTKRQGPPLVLRQRAPLGQHDSRCTEARYRRVERTDCSISRRIGHRCAQDPCNGNDQPTRTGVTLRLLSGVLATWTEVARWTPTLPYARWRSRQRAYTAGVVAVSWPIRSHHSRSLRSSTR